MPKWCKYPILFLIGAIAYGLIEILVCGYTHWTMLLTGGFCFIALYTIGTKFKCSKWIKPILGGILITTVELLVGLLVNVHLGWRVWDYSHHILNFKGQICLLLSVLWTLLCIPVMWLSRWMERKLFNRA